MCEEETVADQEVRERRYTPESLESHRSIGSSIFSGAALILTINLGLITATGSSEVIADIRWPIVGSSISLLVSLFAGVVSLSQVIEIQAGRYNTVLGIQSETLMERSSNIQAWSFFFGLVLIAWAVFTVLGVV